MPPPPAYEQGTWVPPHEQVPQTLVSPPTPTTTSAVRSRKIRNTPVTKRVAASTRHRRTRTQGAIGTLSSPTRPEFDFNRVQQVPAAVEEQEPDDEVRFALFLDICVHHLMAQISDGLDRWPSLRADSRRSEGAWTGDCGSQ